MQLASPQAPHRAIGLQMLDGLVDVDPHPTNHVPNHARRGVDACAAALRVVYTVKTQCGAIRNRLEAQVHVKASAHKQWRVPGPLEGAARRWDHLGPNPSPRKQMGDHCTYGQP